MVAFGQRDLFGPAQPVGQQAHGGHQIAEIQERLGQQGEAPRRAESLDVLSPEADVAGSRAGLVPGGQRLGHLRGRFPHLLAGEPFDAADFGRGELVPPAGPDLHLARKP